MANYHVLNRVGRERWRVVFHIPMIDGRNAHGVEWSEAMRRSGRGGSTILSDGDGTGGTIDAIEKTAVQARTVYEHVGTYPIESNGMSGTRMAAALQRFYDAAARDVMSGLRREFENFGTTSGGG